MKVSQIILSLSLILLFSCQSESGKESKENEIVNSTENEKKKSNEVVSEINPKLKKYSRMLNDSLATDTLCEGEYLVTINFISKDSFINIASENKSKLFQSISTLKYKETFNELTKRINDSTLIISLKSGKKDTVLSNNPKQGYLGFSIYDYISHIPELNSHLLHGSYYEASRYFLIDDSTGQRNNDYLFNCLSINENHSMIATYWYDGFAYATGGIRIFKVQDNNLVELINCGQSDPEKDGCYWGISEVYWLNEYELVCRFERNMIKRSSSRQRQYLSSFVKLKIIN